SDSRGDGREKNGRDLLPYPPSSPDRGRPSPRATKSCAVPRPKIGSSDSATFLTDAVTEGASTSPPPFSVTRGAAVDGERLGQPIVDDRSDLVDLPVRVSGISRRAAAGSDPGDSQGDRARARNGAWVASSRQTSGAVNSTPVTSCRRQQRWTPG